MDTETRIKMACAYLGISQSELARRLGKSPQNFNQQLKREAFSPNELNKIAAALGAKYEAHIVFDDGMVI